MRSLGGILYNIFEVFYAASKLCYVRLFGGAM